MRPLFVFVAHRYSIEPLGLHHLAGVARDANWDCEIVLIENNDFEPLYTLVRDRRPDYVGFQIWTGSHLPQFEACDRIHSLGIPIVIGGPHATYFDQECLNHADYVLKAGSFGLLRRLLEGELEPGTHFDPNGRAEPFPFPDRAKVYNRYPSYAESPIKSMMATVGCPFQCSYCYAPTFNDMHGGFKHTSREVSELIAEAKDIQERGPLSMIYFQDDIFGYNIHWLEEFAREWKSKVGVSFHCQIRLELTRHDAGAKRLDLFAEAGCSGITLAIESGDSFLRDQVLFRHMPDELILEGCERIMSRGMTLRTEQILAVPFSDLGTELSTLDLNNQINPTMTWTSILAPYAGTTMGNIASQFGLYTGNNDDLEDSFFVRSVLRHVEGGPRDIAKVVEEQGFGEKDQGLLQMHAEVNGGRTANILRDEKPVGSIRYLSEGANDRYRRDIVRMQRLFMWIAKVPHAKELGAAIVAIPEEEWSWENLGKVTESHLKCFVGHDILDLWRRSLFSELGVSETKVPPQVSANPWYFVFFDQPKELAKKASHDLLDKKAFPEALDRLGTDTRRHVFEYSLYKTRPARPAVAV